MNLKETQPCGPTGIAQRRMYYLTFTGSALADVRVVDALAEFMVFDVSPNPRAMLCVICG